MLYELARVLLDSMIADEQVRSTIIDAHFTPTGTGSGDVTATEATMTELEMRVDFETKI